MAEDYPVSKCQQVASPVWMKSSAPNAILAALLADPAILALNAIRLAADIRERFGVSPQMAYAAISEAIRQTTDAGMMPEAVAR